MPQVGVIGGSNVARSLPFNAERTVNLFPVLDQNGAFPGSLYSRPGLKLIGNAGTGPGRGCFSAANGRSFVVDGSMLYELFADGTTTQRGSLQQTSGVVTIAENGLQLAICDGVNLYIFTYATNAYQTVVGNKSYAPSNFAGWNAGSGWAISGDNATATGTNTSSDLAVTATNTLVANKVYRISYTITRTAGSVTPSVGGTNGTTRSAAGTYTDAITTTATNQLIKFTGAGFTGTVTNVTVQDTSYGFTSASTVAFIDGYFIISVAPNTGKFQISGIYDGTSWAALDFATAESSPDGLLRVINVAGQLWLLGSRSIEIWADTGALSFPFSRISGAKIEQGVISPYAAISLDNSLFWCGTDVNGSGIVYRADGFSPQRISNSDIERRIQSVPDPASIRFGSYQEDGQTFLRITGGGMETSLYYDLASQLWHERAYLNADGNYELELVADTMFAFGKQVALDRTNGNIYQQSMSFNDDNGFAIARDRVFTHLIDENQRVKYSNLVANFEVGDGSQVDPGFNPQATLYLSRDGGRTWISQITKSIGKVGEYRKRVLWQRLGQSRIMTFRLRVTDPVPVRLNGAWVNTNG